MSGVARLLERAARLGVRLWAEGDRLLWEAEQEPPSALLAELKPSRRELLEALAPRPKDHCRRGSSLLEESPASAAREPTRSHAGPSFRVRPRPS
jgi:hypothetical protein